MYDIELMNQQNELYEMIIKQLVLRMKATIVVDCRARAHQQTYWTCGFFLYSIKFTRSINDMNPWFIENDLIVFNTFH